MNLQDGLYDLRDSTAASVTYSSQDVTAVDLSPFKKTGVNITGFTLLHTASPVYRRVAAADVFQIPRKILVFTHLFPDFRFVYGRLVSGSVFLTSTSVD